MIDRLLTALQQAGLLISDQQLASLSEAISLLQDEDIADALWLAAKMGGGIVEMPTEEESPPAADELEDTVTEENAGMREEELEEAIAPSPPPPPPTVPAILPEPISQSTESEAQPEEGLPIQVQAAPALQDARLIGRALRPLMRKVPSLTQSTLDEAATVDRIAQREIWVPVLKPAQERWFDLELVIESSPFSFIWEDTLTEFQKVLEQQGAFRNVRTWSIEGLETGQLTLLPRRQGISSDTVMSRSPKELVDAAGRRLVLLVSDCRSPVWQQGTIHDWLKLWSQHGPTAIAQLLPERLWDQSELDVGYPAQVSNLYSGAPNDKLQVWELPLRRPPAPQDTLTLPIVTLTEKSIKQWALVVAAAGRQRLPARLFDLNWVKDEGYDRSSNISSPQTAGERIELFRATASPIAQRLAGMMAAVPLRLPVINLIQKRLLPEAKPIHVAEVFSSGLLKSTPLNYGDSEAISYDFAEGVRGLLNETTPLDETIAVLDELSKEIANTLGLPAIHSFTALLSPKSSWSQQVKDTILPFAQITTQVLQRLGGDFAELAELVEQDTTQQETWFGPPLTEPVFPELQILHFTTAQLVEEASEAEPGLEEQSEEFPPLQTEEFVTATVSLDWSSEDSFKIEARRGSSNVLVMAIHGGNLQPGTTEIARAVAGNTHSFYSFISLKDEVDQSLYVLSTEFAEPQALSLLQNADVILSIHGCSGDEEFLRIGGLDSFYRERIKSFCLEAGYGLIEADSGGTNPQNICNKGPKKQGVQIQVSRGLRNQILGADGNVRARDKFERLISALQQGLQDLPKSREKNVTLETFEFVVATLEPKGKGHNPPWEVQRRRVRGQRFVEWLGKVGLEMIAIPDGSFVMGSPRNEPGRLSNEGPQHEVTVQPFFMGRCSIIQAQWKFIATLPQVERELRLDPSSFKRADLPVERVSWYDAVEFCARLSQHTGRDYRLPTEAEWEYACRAGTTTPFHFGRTLISELANYNARRSHKSSLQGEYRGKTTPVKQFGVANAFGLCNMHGNVWEWCQDHWHENYEGAPTDGSAWLSEDDKAQRLLRGGSWAIGSGYCRSAYRTYHAPANANNSVGFRVVCIAPTAL